MSSPLAVALGRVPYFTGLGADELRDLAATARVRRCGAGELVLAEGAVCRGLSFVIAGRVKAFKLSEGGREQVLRILGAGRTFNDVPLFDGGANPASVAALDEGTEVGLLAAARVRALIRDRPEVATAVVRVLAVRLRAMTEMVEDLALRGVGARVARLLLECSRGSPPLAEGAGSDRCAELTQQQLAAMAGTVREVVQRTLKALERDGAVLLARGRIRILAPEILAAWSGAGRAER